MTSEQNFLSDYSSEFFDDSVWRSMRPSKVFYFFVNWFYDFVVLHTYFDDNFCGSERKFPFIMHFTLWKNRSSTFRAKFGELGPFGVFFQHSWAFFGVFRRLNSALVTRFELQKFFLIKAREFQKKLKVDPKISNFEVF